ncbi:MAG: ScbR family autoregulator-binding transcription factor [Mycobacterium sp.]
MARQARSEATRRRILAAAVELFTESGYAATGLGDIIERAALTKGALYYHFDSKEALATALIHDASAAVFEAVDGIGGSSAPALENLIHVSFVIGDLVSSDPMVRTGSQLMRALGEFNDLAVRIYLSLGESITALARTAAAQGDLRTGVDADAVGELFVSTYLGTELLSIGTSGGQDMAARLARGWCVLLPAIATDDGLPYFREFVHRESGRRGRHSTAPH